MRIWITFASLLLAVGSQACGGFDDDDGDDSGSDSSTDSDSDLDGGSAMEWVQIHVSPSTTFVMGSPEDEIGRLIDEAQHEVTLTVDFKIGAFEVTQSEFESVMGYNPSWYTECGNDCPAENISWHDAAVFANTMSENEFLPPCYALSAVTCTDDTVVGDDFWECMNPVQGGIAFATVTVNGGNAIECTGYRLPTEAEWEFAVRSGTTSAFYSGEASYSGLELDPNLDLIGWYVANSSYQTHPKGEKVANAWGLHDANGNVWEWVGDWYGPYALSATDPTGPTEGVHRICRGGSWSHEVQYCRSAIRGAGWAGNHSDMFGIRLARSMF